METELIKQYAIGATGRAPGAINSGANQENIVSTYSYSFRNQDRLDNKTQEGT
jgi:hypothetical protein